MGWDRVLDGHRLPDHCWYYLVAGAAFVRAAFR